LEGLLSFGLLISMRESSDVIGVDCGLRICVSNKSLGKINAIGLERIGATYST
jgi:hypothetical protein